MAGPRRSRSTIIVVLLVATLGMTGMLAYEAVQAARSHRATAENVLTDYAKFSAWELNRVGRQQLLNVLNARLGDVQSAMKRNDLRLALPSAARCPRGCPDSHAVLTVFSSPLPETSFTFEGAPADDGLRAFLAKAAADGLRKGPDFTCPSLHVMPVNGATAVVAWRPVHDPYDRLIGMSGFVADVRFVAHLFEKIVEKTPLLPPSLVPATGLPNAALAVRVAAPDGPELFASSTGWSRYEAGLNLTPDMGALKVAVAIRPEAAETLVIGGLPRQRLPLVLGLLGLTVGLVVVALVQLRRETELSRLRTDFVSGVSHELRTPLAQIRMFTETLLLGRVRSASEGRRSLEIIARETHRLIELVENVLLFSRSERSDPQISTEPQPLAPILTEVVESFAPVADARQAKLVTALDEHVTAAVDAGAVRRILLNLLDNAVKYGPVGQTVSVSLELHGDAAHVIVEDEGPGVDPEDAERIWHPFTRLQQSADATGGAGIGLSIVRQLTSLHGGRASVRRSDAGGARFVIELPRAWSASNQAIAVA